MFRIFFQAERIDKLTETLYPIDLNGEDRTILFNVWKIGDRFYLIMMLFLFIKYFRDCIVISKIPKMPQNENMIPKDTNENARVCLFISSHIFVNKYKYSTY